MEYRNNYAAQRGLYLVLGVLALILGVLSLVYFFQASPLHNTEWRLISINGRPPLAETTLHFSDTRISGTTLCRNSFSGNYKVTADGKLDTSDIAITQIACLNPAITAQDNFYMSVLFHPSAFRVTGDRLEFFNDTGQVVLVFVKR